MARALRPALVGLALAAAMHAALAAGRAEVGFLEPERFTDAGPTPAARARTQHLLEAHLAQLAARLPDGQVLRVRFRDVDLAGRFDPFIDGGVRVAGQAADFPRLVLGYELLAGDRPLAQGEAVLRDLAYMQRGVGPSRGTPLEYETRLLDEWFAAQIVPASAAVR